MRVTVKIENKLYEVHIENLYARPVIATVDGERFEVWPEIGPAPNPALAAAVSPRLSHPAGVPVPATVPAPEAASTPDARVIYAPIPGVIVSIAVESGAAVTTGQELCVLEAMKMKNVIRSPRVGQIVAVRVSTGQHVKHHAVLFEYAEE